MSDSSLYPELGKFNLASFFVDRNLELGRGDRTAIICGSTEYTYRDVYERMNRLGNVLLELGMEMEDRLFMVLNDTIDFVASYFAIMKNRGIQTEAYTYLKVKDYEYFLNYTRAKVAIVDESTRDILAEAAKSSPFLKHILVTGDSPKGLRKNELSLDNLLERASPDLEVASTLADEFSQWKFTTGSTGTPKGTVHTHYNCWYNYNSYCTNVLNYRQDDVVLPVPKLMFGYARDLTMVYTFGVGACGIIFPERTTIERIFELVDKHRPTVMVQVPSMMNAMALSPEAGKHDLSCLRYCTSSGESLPHEVYRRWKDAFGVEVVEGIGSAELYHVYVSNRVDSVVPGSVGKPVPGYEARLLAPSGESVPVGEPGTLHVRGGSAGVLYWNDRKKSIATFAGDWVNTGDLFISDEEGNLYFSGRGDHMIKVSGIWVSPAEIENCLLEHPLIKEAAVIPYQEVRGLVLPLAVVVLRESAEATLEESNVIAYVKDRLAPYKAPRKVAFMDDLPRTPSGKVDKKALLAMDWSSA